MRAPAFIAATLSACLVAGACGNGNQAGPPQTAGTPAPASASQPPAMAGTSPMAGTDMNEASHVDAGMPPGSPNPAHAEGATASMPPGAMKSMATGSSERGQEIPSGDPVPTVALHDDGYAHGVWSFSVTTNLNLTMDDEPYTPMRGHMHVYVDGAERQMIARRQFALANLAPGPHTVEVVLASTTHRNLLHHGKPIAASVKIVVPAP
jgi:hypothetical protein